jgi:hypothetical protein
MAEECFRRKTSLQMAEECFRRDSSIQMAEEYSRSKAAFNTNGRRIL